MAKWPWEVAPIDLPPEAVTGRKVNPFSRSLAWLRNGLGLNANEVPNELNVGPVVDVIDVGQNGWGVVEFHQLAGTLTAAAPVANLVAPRAFGQLISAGFVHRVLAIRLVAGAFAGPHLVRLDLVYKDSGTPSSLTAVMLAAGDDVGTAQVLSGVAPIVPNEWILRLQAFTLAGAETVPFSVAIARTPAGYSLAL